MMVERQTFRSPTLYAAACATEIAAPLLRVFARMRNPGNPTHPSTWRTALLLGADHIGDVLYRTPSLHALKRSFPDCEWLFAVSGSAGEVLANNPHVTPVILPAHAPDKSAALANALRGKVVDAVLCYNSGGYWTDLLTALDLGISNRVGYVHKGCSAWVTHPAKINFPQPYPAYFRDLVAQLTQQTGDWSLRPLVYPSDQDHAEANALWDDLHLGQTPVLACFPFTRQTTPSWSANNFAQALKSVAESTGVQPLLCGGPDDGHRLSALATQATLSCPVLAGRLNLRALTAFLSRTALVFANDSGPRHLANAAGVQVAFIRNLWPRRIETGCYLDTETDLAPMDDCLSGKALHSALTALTSDSVAEALTRLVRSSASLACTASARRSAVT